LFASETQKEECSQFYSNYLAKYYPRANIIKREFWVGATPEEVVSELNDVVNVLTNKPWFYVTDNPKGFNVGHYWEFLVDQCSLISSFLQHAQIDEKTKKIYLPQQADEDFGYMEKYFGNFLQAHDKTLKQNVTFLTYCKKTGQKAQNDFYALCFDYVVKLFNEGILTKDIRQAQRYYHDLENILNRLRGSDYEVNYQDSLKTCMELMTRLQHKVGFLNRDMELSEEKAFAPSASEGFENFSSGSDTSCVFDDVSVDSKPAYRVIDKNCILTETVACNFIESFVKHYEFSPEGRYTHEYHTALLSKTAGSF